MSEKQVALTQGQRYDGAKQIAFELLVTVTSFLTIHSPEVKLNIAKTILRSINHGYYYLGKEMPLMATQLVDPSVKVPVDLILAKIVHYSSNYFSLILTHKDTWEDNYLDYDLYNLFRFISLFTIQELGVNIHGPSETISYPENYSGDKANP